MQAGFPAQRNLRQAPQSQRVSSVGLGLAGALPGPPKGPGWGGGLPRKFQSDEDTAMHSQRAAFPGGR